LVALLGAFILCRPLLKLLALAAVHQALVILIMVIVDVTTMATALGRV